MDTPTFQAIRERHVEFRPRLVELIRQRKGAEAARQAKLAETYCTLAARWFKKVEKVSMFFFSPWFLSLKVKES